MRKIRLTGSLALKDNKNDKDDISALLTEYSAIKAEETACEQSQVQITTAVFSFIGVVLSLNFLFQGNGETVSQSSRYLVLGFCPILVMFFGCLYVYQLYCQIILGAWLFSPFLLIYFAAGFFPNWDVCEFYWKNWQLSIGLGGILFIYCIVQVVYVTAILSLKAEKNLNRDRI